MYMSHVFYLNCNGEFHKEFILSERHIYPWVTSPFLLIKFCNDLGTEDINDCSFAMGIFAHSWCIQDLMDNTFSIGDRQSSQAHALYAYEAKLLQLVQNEAWHCPAEMDMEFLGKVVILTAAYVQNCMHPHTITKGGFCTFRW